jgi:hypothetical protein
LRIESLLSFAFMNLMNDVLKHSSCAEMRVQRHPTAGGEGAFVARRLIGRRTEQFRTERFFFMIMSWSVLYLVRH